MMDVLRRFFDWSRQTRRRAVIVLGGLVLLCFCCPATAIIGELTPATATPAPTAVPVAVATATATPTRTATPSPTETETPLPTNTPLPTVTSTPVPPPTATITPRPTATATPEPTSTSTPAPTATAVPTPVPTVPPAPTAPPAPSGPMVRILRVDKVAEYVDLINRGDQAQDLSGWTLLSEKGSQRCGLGGVIQPGATLRVHTEGGNNAEGHFYCGFGGPIWNNSERDPAVLLAPGGVEVDRR